MFEGLKRRFEERPADIYVPSVELITSDFTDLTDEEREILTSQLQIPPAPCVPEDNNSDLQSPTSLSVLT
jgi:hypothetical protein